MPWTEAEYEEWIRTYTVPPTNTLYPRIGFGKHTGLRINELPMSYLQWMQSGALGSFYAALARAAARNADEIPQAKDFVNLYMNEKETRIIIDAPFELVDDVKALPGREWDSDAKEWSVPVGVLNMVYQMFPDASTSESGSALLKRKYLRQTELF